MTCAKPATSKTRKVQHRNHYGGTLLVASSIIPLLMSPQDRIRLSCCPVDTTWGNWRACLTVSSSQ
ncbi:hypothetical protein KP79_PYT04687 [Mizuhopecten yessoensis]|uniref:Uncharacterized protein n=1 Tax=Mizuhopecten yessoensis TaxID=6573 RepID=A0A210PLW4_MIZYE|nr:hypothetical protein KP79_PYT04687 [Mizuhopecten yessoensis]